MTLADKHRALWTMRNAIQHLLNTDPGGELLTTDGMMAMDVLEHRYDALLTEYEWESSELVARIFTEPR